MSIVGQVFSCFAIPATLLLLVQTVMMFIGFGGDDGIGDDIPDDLPDASDLSGADSVFDEPADFSGLEGLRIFTLRGIIAFFVVFGWVGVSMDAAGCPLYATLPVAIVCGFAMMVALAFIFLGIMKLRNDGNTDNRNALGTSGKVHLTIPASRSGDGKIHIMLQGAYVERNAVTDEDAPIPTGAEVTVIGISGETDLIVKRK